MENETALFGEGERHRTDSAAWSTQKTMTVRVATDASFVGSFAGVLTADTATNGFCEVMATLGFAVGQASHSCRGIVGVSDVSYGFHTGVICIFVPIICCNGISP